MAAARPTRLTLTTYDVGFGDCFLLTFHYPRRSRHLLIDFGSMRLPTGKTIKGYSLNTVAEAIRRDCGGRLDAVIATHRHQDHISGFGRRGGKGPGEIIRSLRPALVIQPWTEDPRAARDATAPTRRSFARALLDMQAVAGQVRNSARALGRAQDVQALRAQLEAIGMDNIANPDAVDNLRTMAPNRYVYHGADAGLGRLLPGIKVTVLGPPTVEQSDAIKSQRSTDADEFWHLTSRFWNRLAATRDTHFRGAPALFRDEATGPLPRSAGWFRYTVLREQSESLLSIVRMLDKAMNNTSVILLFEVAGKSVLFPGDAQYENWMYALSKEAIRKRLADVDLYKVGHHGSLNATPKTLWNGFARRSTKSGPGRLKTVLSTMPGVHGSTECKTEVPRSSLLNALSEQSDLTDTESFAADEVSRTVTLEL